MKSLCSKFLFCCWSVSFLFAQTSPQISIEFLVPEFLITSNFESESFLKWGQTFRQTLESTFSNNSTNATGRDILVLMTLSPNRELTLEISAKPAYEEAERENLLALLKKNAPPSPKRSEIPILFSIRLLKGVPDNTLEYAPKIKTPLEKRKLLYQSKTVLEHRQLLQQWAIQEVLPTLSEYMETLGDEFAGIAAMAKQSQQVLWNESVPWLELGEQNSSYWIALMEMEPGNHLFPALLSFMCVARGDFEIARRYLNLLKMFSNPEELATYYLQDLFWKLEQFFLKYHQSLQEGQKRVLAKEFDLAKQHFDELQQSYPHSPHLLYELYCLEQLQKTSPNSLEQWEKARQKIFLYDPFFKAPTPNATPEEAFEQARRKEASLLFVDENALASDFIEYADVALDIKAYSFAAHLYWFAFTYFSEDLEEQKRLLCSFFYCLQVLGHTQLHRFAQGISLEEIQEVPQERKKRMQQHPAYQSFKEKE